MTNEEYINKLFELGLSSSEVNILYKIYTKHNIDLSYMAKDISNATDINDLKKFDTMYHDYHIKKIIDLVTEQKVNILPIMHENFIIANTEYEIYNLLTDPIKCYDLSLLKNNTYSKEQMQAYLYAITKDIDIRDLLDPSLKAPVLESLIEAKINGIDIYPFKSFENEQIKIIVSAILYNRTHDNIIDISVLLNKKLSSDQMNSIALAMKNKVDYKYFLDDKLNKNQIQIILEGLCDGIDVDIFKDFNEQKMKCANKILRATIDATEETKEKIKELLNNNYNSSQTKFLAYCIYNDINYNEFKDPKYDMFEMIEIAKFIKLNKNNEYINLETFKNLGIKEKTFVNNLFVYKKEILLEELDLNNFNEDMVLNSLFFRINEEEDINNKIKFIDDSEYLDEDKIIELDNGQKIKVSYDYDYNYESEYTSVTEDFSEIDWLNDKEDVISNILNKTTYFKYNDENETYTAYCMTQKTNDKDFELRRYFTENSSLFNTFDCFLSLDKSELLEDILLDCMDELYAYRPGDEINYCPIDNVNDFHKYGYANFNDVYLCYKIDDHNYYSYVYMDIEYAKKRFKEELNINDEEALNMCIDYFNADITELENIINGNTYYFQVFENNEEVDAFCGIGNYKKVIEDYTGAKIVEKTIDDIEK